MIQYAQNAAGKVRSAVVKSAQLVGNGIVSLWRWLTSPLPSKALPPSAPRPYLSSQNSPPSSPSYNKVVFEPPEVVEVENESDQPEQEENEEDSSEERASEEEKQREAERENERKMEEHRKIMEEKRREAERKETERRKKLAEEETRKARERAAAAAAAAEEDESITLTIEPKRYRSNIPIS